MAAAVALLGARGAPRAGAGAPVLGQAGRGLGQLGRARMPAGGGGVGGPKGARREQAGWGGERAGPGRGGRELGREAGPQSRTEAGATALDGVEQGRAGAVVGGFGVAVLCVAVVGSARSRTGARRGGRLRCEDGVAGPGLGAARTMRGGRRDHGEARRLLLGAEGSTQRRELVD
ncbi:spidroin-1-like [Sorghum bicolor]|uniref:spidroin-1-like n=1 Tax=Sorghum bicolor TaxID=4558 RepID=UPI000B424F77|nr:spidroin-1-like [Sorghum bicolor]|eukprot:XP_021321385.1 spidroin-1-like [Sorghum bicolor]